MSVHAYAWAWQQPVNDSTDRLVLIALCEFADATGLCWPSVPTVARMTGLHRTTVFRSIAQLVDDGHLLRAKGRGKSNTYRLNLSGPRYASERPDLPAGADPATARSRREARESLFVEPSYPHPSPSATGDPSPSATGVDKPVAERYYDPSLSATPPVAQRYPNRKEPLEEPRTPRPVVHNSGDNSDLRPGSTMMTEEHRADGLDHIAALRAQLAFAASARLNAPTGPRPIPPTIGTHALERTEGTPT